jgi:hypothetical protein
MSFRLNYIRNLKVFINLGVVGFEFVGLFYTDIYVKAVVTCEITYVYNYESLNQAFI